MRYPLIEMFGLSKSPLTRRLVIGALIVGLAGCASAPLATYDLKALGEGLPSRRASRATLSVPVPTATLILDSQRIAIKTGSDLAYLKGAQWSMRLPELIQSRLITSLENSHRLSAVSQPSQDARYKLETDVRHFEVDVAHSTASVEIYARLTRGGGEIVADRDFKAAAFAPSDDAVSVSAAIDTALTQVLRQIVIWTAIKV